MDVSGIMPAGRTKIASGAAKGLEELEREIITCGRCKRLVRYRQQVVERRPPRYRDWAYWGKPLPGFGDCQARLLILGLAPAAHGGNRTGRMFTGDRSGDWLMEALFRFGFANQSQSQRAGDGLALKDAYITATLRCCPPDNKPLPSEVAACRPYLLQELRLLGSVRVLVALGRIAFASTLAAFLEAYRFTLSPRPAFGHGQVYPLPNGQTLIASFHPSQQNTQTGRLSQEMFDHIFARAKKILGSGPGGADGG